MLISCKKSELNGVAMAGLVTIEYKNNHGANLLDPLTTNAIKAEDIDIFVMRNGVKTRILYNNLRDPENFNIHSTVERGNVMDLYFDMHNESFNNNIITMFIRYKDGSEDKITGEFNVDWSPSKFIKKVWINDILSWESVNNLTNAHVTIIK